MIDLHIDKAGLQRAAQELGATDAQVLQAVRSTISNMARWARSRSVRELAGGLVVPQEILRPRIKAQRLRRTATGAEAGVWYGLNPVALIRLGARRTRAGVSAKGGRHIEGPSLPRLAGASGRCSGVRGVPGCRLQCRLPGSRPRRPIIWKTTFRDRATSSSSSDRSSSMN